MPTGPSHSSGGFSGHSSHSGGGSSFGGFGGGNSGRYRHTGPHHFHWFGRTYIISGGYYSSAVQFISVAIFLIIFAVFMGFMAYSNATDVKEYKALATIYEEDAEFYSDLIKNAKDGVDGFYRTTATFDGHTYYDYEYDEWLDTGIYYYDRYNNNPYFFIKYAYENPYAEEPGTYVGETYVEYSSSKAQSYVKFAQDGSGIGKLDIAYTYADGAWWSINVDYKLDNNIEYQYTLDQIGNKQGSQNILIGSVVVFAIIIAGCILGAVLKFVRGAKKAKAEAEFEEQKNEAELSEARARASEAMATAESKQSYVCGYCGSDIPTGESKCPMCGSAKKVKKHNYQ